MDRPLEAVDVMTQAVVMADLVAELVTERVIERHHAIAARAAVHLDAIGVDAPAIMRRKLRDGIGMALLTGAGGGVQSVVGVVDAMRDQLLADVLAHRAFMPAAFARIDFLEEHARGQHHFLEVHRRILTDDQLAGRDGLEILAMRFRVLGETERAARGRQETQVDRVQQQLRRRADIDRGKLAGRLALDETQGETRTDPFSRQIGAPRVARVTQPVIREFTFAEPAATGGLEDDGLPAGDTHLLVTIMDRRAVAGAGVDADDLAVDGLRRREIDILHPASVSRSHFDEGVLGHHGAQLAAILLRQLRDAGRIIDQAERRTFRREIQPARRNAFHEVSCLRQERRRIELQRTELLAGTIHRRDRNGGRVGTQRTNQQKSFTQADETRLAVILARTGRNDLALSEKHLSLKIALKVILRRRGIKDQRRLRSTWSGDG